MLPIEKDFSKFKLLLTAWLGTAQMTLSITFGASSIDSSAVIFFGIL